jgi:hypothetical protein
MGTALGTALVLLSLAVLIYPLIKRRAQLSQHDPALGRLNADRRRIYGLIADLEDSRASGDVSEADFKAQLDELRLAAAKTLQQEAMIGRPADAARLEQEIEAARKARTRSGRGRQ